MKNKKLRMLFIAICGILGVFLAFFIRKIGYQLQKPINDYFSTIASLLCGITILSFAFSERFKTNDKARKKYLLLGSLVFSCGIIMLVLQLV